MDEKRSNIRLVKTGGRRVTKTTTEYDGNSLEKRFKDEKRRYGNAEKRNSSNLAKKVRYQKRQKQRRLKKQRRRALLVLIMSALLVLILMFMTPIFNIKQVSVEGNSLVAAEQFEEKLKPLIGENLFRTGEGKIRKTLKTIPLIDKVDVQKKMFPPSVKVVVSEYVPAGMIKSNGSSILVNSQLTTLTDDGNMVTQVPVITGFNISDYQSGKEIKSDESEKKEAVRTILKTLESTGILDKVFEINIQDITNITLNYDYRLNVLCGTQLGLERKIRLFRESVYHNEIDENARGTMDLTVPGYAEYIP